MTVSDPAIDVPDDLRRILARIRTLCDRKGPKAALKRLDRVGDRLPPPLLYRERARLRLRLLTVRGDLGGAIRLVRENDLGAQDADRDPMLALVTALMAVGRFTQAGRMAARLPLSPPRPAMLRALLLGGMPGRFHSALAECGAAAGDRLLTSVQQARVLLAEHEDPVAEQALIAGAEAALPLITLSGRAQKLRLLLFPYAPDTLDRQIWDQAVRLECAAAPASLRDLQVPPAPVPDRVVAPLTRIADWIGIAPEARPDWIARAYHGRLYQRRLHSLLICSDSHRTAFADTLPPLDWSAVRACQDRGQPVLLTAAHHIFVPAVVLHLQRSGLDVQIIAGGWRWGPDAAEHFPFLPGSCQLYPDGTTPELSPAALRRGLITQLRAKGCALVAVDSAYGTAREFELPGQGLQVRLPPPLWSVARKTGAAVFAIRSLWQDGQIVSQLQPWPVPPADPDGQDTALWYTHVLEQARDAALLDAWNVALPSWLIARTDHN